MAACVNLASPATVSVHAVSSEMNACLSSHVLVEDPQLLWLSGVGFPQHFTLQANTDSNIELLRTPVQSIGWYCWYVRIALSPSALPVCVCVRGTLTASLAPPSWRAAGIVTRRIRQTSKCWLRRTGPLSRTGPPSGASRARAFTSGPFHRCRCRRTPSSGSLSSGPASLAVARVAFAF